MTPRPSFDPWPGGGTVEWGNGVYRHTGIDVAVETIRWRSNGARLVYDGAQRQYAVKITVSTSASRIEGALISDAGQAAHVAIRIESDESENLPSFYAAGLQGINARRISTDYSGGDGISVAGSFERVQLDRPVARDCHMADGAEVLSVQGIFGISVGSPSGPHIKHIVINDPHVENVWSEKVDYKNDQDGIRIFQDMEDPDATCVIRQYTCKNVSNRAVKLHSAPNAVVDGVLRVLDASVIPQSGAFTNPDIEAQRAPATIRNVRFHYKGAWHEDVVRNHTDEGDYRYGGSLTSGISGLIEDCAGNDISVVALASSADGTTTYPDSIFRATISDVAILGPVARFVNANHKGTGEANIVTVANAVGEVTSEGFRASGTGTADLRLFASNIVNTGAEVPLTTDFINNRAVSVANARGFSGGSYFVASSTGLGLNLEPETVLDIQSVSNTQPRVRLRGSTQVTTEDSYVGTYEWYHQVLGSRLGVVGFNSNANSDLELRNEATTGDVCLKIGSSTRVRARRSGGVALSGASECDNTFTAPDMRLGSSGPRVRTGTGSPEGVVTASIGSIYLRQDGGAGTSLYIKESGTGNTGWVAK